MLFPPRVHRLGTAIDPADAFAALFPDGEAVWLDSGPDAVVGRSVLGTGTRILTASAAAGTVTLDGATRAGSAFETLTGLLSAPMPASGLHPLAASSLGWTGWLGYEAGAARLGLPVATGPGWDAAFLLVDRAVVFDHATGDATLLDASADPGSWVLDAADMLRSATGAAAAHESGHPVLPAPVRWRHDDDAYLLRIAACQDAIRAGDAYQLCLTNTAEAHTAADPLAVHLRLRRTSPAHHAGFLRIAGETLVSSSPEQFLHVAPDGRVQTKPVKGTRRRGRTPAADRHLRAELEASEKERAENVMIVDLMRNDLGRVCETGSVGVHRLLAVESYTQVHQLVSTVEGRLRDGLGAVDALAACFPAGSMTGAPKLSAMRILHRLEQGPRGVYAGCFGLFAVDGSADLAMVIRSLRFRNRTVTVGAGGGITALSVPAEELEEVRIKAAALLRAAGLIPAGNGLDAANV